MKYVLYFFIGLMALILLGLIVLSVSSRFKENTGLNNGKLAACPEKPNCICTENFPNQNFEPIVIDSNSASADWALFKSAIVEAGGEIKKADDYYLWATFVTPLFRFVDDFEARLDINQTCIHLRSASRVGGYDFGTNLKRVKRIVDIYHRLKNREN